ncbi:hypothetical protein CAEBREN_17845 [Caenorhabditis brenneri]|uniref:Uncharacterized protein n=1 Tax=Caenorhabditis brenneri TaxID=135651 RepID=G0ND06_CAEBE|nr:hypothetical protein CAEBREN_17845 [Caenorhabditis brenneri]
MGDRNPRKEREREREREREGGREREKERKKRIENKVWEKNSPETEYTNRFGLHTPHLIILKKKKKKKKTLTLANHFFFRMEDEILLDYEESDNEDTSDNVRIDEEELLRVAPQEPAPQIPQNPSIFRFSVLNLAQIFHATDRLKKLFQIGMPPKLFHIHHKAICPVNTIQIGTENILMAAQPRSSRAKWHRSILIWQNYDETTQPKEKFDSDTFVLYMCFDCRLSSRKLEVIHVDGNTDKLHFSLTNKKNVKIYSKNRLFHQKTHDFTGVATMTHDSFPFHSFDLAITNFGPDHQKCNAIIISKMGNAITVVPFKKQSQLEEPILTPI